MAELQTLLKALDILNLLGESDSKLSVEEISNSLEIPESTTYRLLQTLEKRGFIERESRGCITLGYSVLNLARDTYEKLDRQLSIAATPILEDLTDYLCETTMISIRSGLYSTCLKSVPCKERIRFVADEKRLLPIYLAASGRAILAYENEKIISLTKKEVHDKEKVKWLEEQLDFTIKNGYSISRSEYDEGTLGVGVPVFNSYGHIYASLAMVGPEYRTKDEKIEEIIVPALKEASKRLTEQLSE